MRWVQQNIAAFGGDPHHVTIFGESGGASSVCDQIASPTAKGLFEGVIDGSGEYNTLFGGPGVRPGGGYDLEPQDCKSSLPSQSQADSIGAGVRGVHRMWVRNRGCRGLHPGAVHRHRPRGLGHSGRRVPVRWTGHDRGDDQRHDGHGLAPPGAPDRKGEPGASDDRLRSRRGSRR